MPSVILPYFYCKQLRRLKIPSSVFKIQGFLKKIWLVSFGRDLESMMTILRLDAGLSALIVPLTQCSLNCKNFRYTCWLALLHSSLHPSLHPKRREPFWFWEAFSLQWWCSAYVKMHEPALPKNELFILWFLSILLL